MKLLVRHLMDRGLDGLHLTHPFLNGDAVLDRMKISLGSAVDLLEADRHRAGFFQSLKEHLILRHITGQFIYANRGQRFPIRLADIKDIDHFECGHQNFLAFLGAGSIRIFDDLTGDGIRLIDFHLLFVGSRGKNADPAFALLDLTAKLLLPGRISGYQCGIRFLHGDQKRVVQRIIMELGKGLQVLLKFLALKECLNSRFQLIRNSLYLLKLRRVDLLLTTHKHSSDFFFPAAALGIVSASDSLATLAARFSRS